MKSTLWGMFCGLVVFLIADYNSTKSSDHFKKAIFEEGYRSALGDITETINKGDTVFVIQKRVDGHWERVKELYKHGE